MSDTRESLLARARQVWADLEFLSEASAATPPDAKSEGGAGAAESRPPTGIGASAETAHFERRLGGLVAEFELSVKVAKRRLAQEPESRDQFRFRVLNDEKYKGRSAQYIADREAVSVHLIEKIRQGVR